MANSELVRLSLTGDPAKLGESLQAIRDFAMSASERAGIDKKAASRLRLAVDEIATNIILYGYRDAGLSGDVVIEAEIDPVQLRVTLIDQGIAFDPMSHDMPDDLDDPLEDRGIGGLGIFLVIKNVDEFRYERANNSNYNHFIMKR